MTLNIFSSEQFNPRSWSGGKTTELFIHPASSKYSERNFDFRLSTATVAVETSIFSPLEGVSRTLMVLDGEMTLTHMGQHVKTCRKFEVDRFDGGWKTSSVGRCTDFNLMTKGHTSGKLESLVIKAEEIQHYSSPDLYDQFFLYVHKGTVSVMAQNLVNSLKKGDLFIIQEFDNSKVTIHGIENSELVICKIMH